MKLACVLRAGGDFGSADVNRLVRSIIRTGNEKLFDEVVCFTDSPRGLMSEVKVIPLMHDWPGWWSKLEIFRFIGPVLYLDLDSVAVGSLDPLVTATREAAGMVMVDGFYGPEECSGILGWSGNMRWIYDAFVAASLAGAFIPGATGPAFRTSAKTFRGDQNWLREALASKKVRIDLAQNVCDGIVSFKVHIRPSGGLPPGSRLVCFHGKPRPKDINPVPEWMAK